LKDYFGLALTHLFLFIRKFGSQLENKGYRFLSENPKYHNYSIGRYSYADPPLTVLNWGEKATLRIGSFCSISSNVTIFLGGEHRVDWVSTFPLNVTFNDYKHFKRVSTTKGDVTIGNDVWIGLGATILSGVTIGDGAVVGAFSVVAKDVAPYAIVAGNPARLIRMRFDQETINNLLKIRWWDWNTQRIKDNIGMLLSDNVKEFINKNYQEKKQEH